MKNPTQGKFYFKVENAKLALNILIYKEIVLKKTVALLKIKDYTACEIILTSISVNFESVGAW